MTSLAERGQCVLLKPDDPCALAYHALRNSLEETLTPGTDKTILITSPADSRGTSVLASNLAISTARSGKRVALVDARHSLRAINEIYGIEDHIGLSDAITGRLKVAAALHVTGLDGLEVLPVGSAEADWAELLNRPEFLQVLTELTERFDRVIIDGGCALSGECRIISAFCDATLLFADGRKSDRNDLRAAAEGLRAVGANIVGIALKGVSSQSSSTELTLAWSQLRGLWSRSASPRQGFKNSNTVSKTNGKKSRDAFAASFPDRSGLTSDGAPVESDGSRIS
jgi:tyrosine-protein kinase Etk/Wzc